MQLTGLTANANDLASKFYKYSYRKFLFWYWTCSHMEKTIKIAAKIKLVVMGDKEFGKTVFAVDTRHSKQFHSCL